MTHPTQSPRSPRIAAIVLAVVVALCGSGAIGTFALVRWIEGDGQPTPAAAVQGFLSALFVDGDVAAATDYVCADAREDLGLNKKLEDLRGARSGDGRPRYTWPEPVVEKRDGRRATVTTTVTATSGGRGGTERRLRFLTVEKSGWWVCGIR